MAQLNEWLSPQEAVRISGWSTKLLNRCVVEGRIRCSRTPEGHRRYARTDIERLHSTNAPAPAAASSVLQNRKERVEELVLESQELRAKRVLEKLREEGADRERQRLEARRAEAAARELALVEQGRGAQVNRSGASASNARLRLSGNGRSSSGAGIAGQESVWRSSSGCLSSNGKLFA